MPQAQANGIRLEYDVFGDPTDRPLVLIMGLACQMIFWDEAFCEALAERGHYVVRFDNRDIGRSTRFDDAGAPSLFKAWIRLKAGRPIAPVYTLDDMAADTVGLIDALGLDGAHLCGASMGGMIAQVAAIRHPRRVRSLTSIMSSTGNPRIGPNLKGLSVLLRPAPTEREAFIEYSVGLWRTLAGSGFPYREEHVRMRASRTHYRGLSLGGAVRQMLAIIAQHDRRPALAELRLPALVIHGTEDPLAPIEGGRETARAIPGARLLEIPGMGHDLPPEVWPRVMDAITELTEGAERRQPAVAAPAAV